MRAEGVPDVFHERREEAEVAFDEKLAHRVRKEIQDHKGVVRPSGKRGRASSTSRGGR